MKTFSIVFSSNYSTDILRKSSINYLYFNVFSVSFFLYKFLLIYVLLSMMKYFYLREKKWNFSFSSDYIRILTQSNNWINLTLELKICIQISNRHMQIVIDYQIILEICIGPFLFELHFIRKTNQQTFFYFMLFYLRELNWIWQKTFSYVLL
jgi:hypothetical protein